MDHGRIALRLAGVILVAVAWATIAIFLPSSGLDTAVPDATTGWKPNMFSWNKIKPGHELKWHDCYSEFQCARLSVPLNYSDPDGTMAAIALIRKPSPFSVDSPEYRGPLLMNPGGPGGSGVGLVRRAGARLSTIAGPQFDIVGFDPRGVGRSTPRASFFDDPVESALWDGNLGLHDLNASADGVARQWASSTIINRLAAERIPDALRHINTDHTARDMLKIVEAHGRGKLQYWGFSYGSILGSTFAAMFPDKVERLIIDAVADAEDYYKTLWSRNLIDTDKTMQHFFDGCHAAGPLGCAFYAPTPSAIARNLSALYDVVRLRPVPVKTEISYGIVDYNRLRMTVFTSLYSPFAMFVPLAQALADLSAGDGRRLFELMAAPNLRCDCDTDGAEDDGVLRFHASAAILCNDGDPVPSDLESFQGYFEDMASQSTWGEIWAAIRASCVGWPELPKTHFRGPVTGNTSHPILLIGNTADPVTPLWAAKKMSRAFPESVVLTQDSPGHGSLSAPSLCTAKYIRNYLVDGVLPPPDTVCAVVGSPFDIRLRSAQEDAQVPLVLTTEDRDLLEAVRNLSMTERHRLPI